MADPFLERDASHGGTIDRATFLDKFRFKLLGIVFEATTIKFKAADGGESYERERERLLRECDRWLTQMYDELAKK